MGWRIWPDLAGGGGVGSWWCGLWFVVDGWWLLERARDTLSPHLVFCSLSPHFVGRNEDEDDPSAFRPLSILSPRPPFRQPNFLPALFPLVAMLCYILTHKHTSFARRAGFALRLRRHRPVGHGAAVFRVCGGACHQQHRLPILPQTAPSVPQCRPSRHRASSTACWLRALATWRRSSSSRFKERRTIPHGARSQTGQGLVRPLRLHSHCRLRNHNLLYPMFNLPRRQHSTSWAPLKSKQAGLGTDTASTHAGHP